MKQQQPPGSPPLDDLIAELGRQGGLLKLNMTSNAELQQRDPTGWGNVEKLIRFLERYARIFREKLELTPKAVHSPPELYTLRQTIDEAMISIRAQGIALRDIVQPGFGETHLHPMNGKLFLTRRIGYLKNIKSQSPACWRKELQQRDQWQLSNTSGYSGKSKNARSYTDVH